MDTIDLVRVAKGNRRFPTPAGHSVLRKWYVLNRERLGIGKYPKYLGHACASKDLPFKVTAHMLNKAIQNLHVWPCFVILGRGMTPAQWRGRCGAKVRKWRGVEFDYKTWISHETGSSPEVDTVSQPPANENAGARSLREAQRQLRAALAENERLAGVVAALEENALLDATIRAVRTVGSDDDQALASPCCCRARCLRRVRLSARDCRRTMV